MTTIITRVFSDPAAAHAAADRLAFKGVPSQACDVIVSGDGSEAAMERAQVHPSAISAYDKKLASGCAVLVVRATYKPLGVASIVRNYVDGLETVEVAKVTQEYRAAWEPERAPSILKDHPHMMSFSSNGPTGNISAMFGMPMLKKRKVKQNLKTDGKPMSRVFWPMKLISQKSRSSSVIHGGRHMSQLFWPMKLISSGQRANSTIPGGGLPFSRRFGMKTIS